MTSLLEPPADLEVGRAVRPRALVPTRREESVGSAVAVQEPSGGVDEAVVKRPRERRIRLFLKDFAASSDPRGIEGSRVALVVFALIAFVGAWDDAALTIIFPELQADFTFDVVFLLAAGVLIPTFVDLLAMPLGYLADRVKRVNLVRLGLVLQNLASILTGISTTIGALLGSFALKGVAFGVPLPAQLSLQSDYFPARSRIRALSLFATFAVVGGIVGPIVAGVIATAYGWRATLVVLGAIAVAASLGTFFLREPVRGYWDRLEAGATDDVASVEQEPLPFREAFRIARGSATIRRFWYAGLFGYPVLYSPVGISLLLMGLYFAELGVDPLGRGLIVAAAGVVALLTLPYAGAVTNRLLTVNPGRVMVLLGLSSFVRAVSLILIAVSPHVSLAILFFLPTVFLGAIIQPAVQGLQTLVIPANMRGFGTQTGKPFEIVGRLLIPLFLTAGAILAAPFGPSTAQAALIGVALPTVFAGAILASAAGAVGRDMRAARAASVADEENRRAQQLGATKLLVCRDLDVSYQGTQVLFGVDFDVEQGELVALLGTNGAGKSTLLRAIAGTQPASSGAVFVDGRDVTHQPVHENAGAGIVMVPGGHAVFPTLTVTENLDVAGWLYDDDEELAARRATVLELFPVLGSRGAELAGSLSGGEQQMLAIGSALLMRPRLLMIDELSLGLAPSIVEELLAALRRIHAMGTTIIVVEQSVNVATAIAHRAVFMEKGEIRYDGPTAELMSQPQLVRAVFMGGALGSATERATRPPSGADADAEHVLLDVRGVGVRFGGVQALTDVDLQIHGGEVVGIIGPNGAGKTTLFDVVSGFVRPDAGELQLDDIVVTSLAPDARSRLGLGRSFQAARLFPALTVRENIAVAMEQRLKVRSSLLTALWVPAVRADERRVARRVDALVEILGLQAFADKFVDELSTGSRRAVDIACVMASQPKLLLLDEPSSGLAQAETEELGPVLERVARETGCAMLVIEHDIGLVSSISQRLVAMELGRVIATGAPAAVLNDRRVLTSYLAATEDVLARSDLARAVLGDSPPAEAART